MKLSIPRLALAKPTLWDILSIALVAFGGAAAALNWRVATSLGPGDALSTSAASLFALTQLGVCVACLTLLGKTAKQGTVLGDLAAALGILVGIGGSLLAATLWAAA